MSVAAIKIMQKELNLSDSGYRELLHNVTGFRSAKLLDEKQCKAVLARMYQLKRECEKQPKTPAEAKAWSLWFELKDYLRSDQQSIKYFAGFVSHIKPVNLNGSHLSLKNFNKAELHKLIEALKARIEYEKQLLENIVPF